MGGNGVAEVVESRADSIPTGSLVSAPTGWQSLLGAHAARHVHLLDAGTDPATALGVLGTNGLTAYFGLLEVGQPQPGDTVVVSAAAGSVGHIVGQIAKIHGCRVVGIAGADDKCRMLVDELGFDVAVSYKDPEFRSKFKDTTPDRIDVYFDNTGGPVLESALFRMAQGGRIACCGVVSQYDTSTPGPGPRGVPGLLVNNRVRMEGFLVFDFADRYEQARRGHVAVDRRRLAEAEGHRVPRPRGSAAGVRRTPRRPHRRHHRRHHLTTAARPTDSRYVAPCTRTATVSFLRLRVGTGRQLRRPMTRRTRSSAT